MNPIVLILISVTIWCSRLSTPTPTPRIDCPVQIVVFPVDTMPVKRDVCECLNCGATWPCE